MVFELNLLHNPHKIQDVYNGGVVIRKEDGSGGGGGGLAAVSPLARSIVSATKHFNGGITI